MMSFVFTLQIHSFHIHFVVDLKKCIHIFCGIYLFFSQGNPGCPGIQGTKGTLGEIGNSGPPGKCGSSGPRGDPGPSGCRGMLQ